MWYKGQIHNQFTIKADNLTQVGIWWLMAAYVYYCRPDLESFLTDQEFDKLNRILMDNFDKLADLSYKTVPNLITMERLKAGTAYDLREHDYPRQTRDAAVHCTMDKFWKLKQKFIFKFPHVQRVGMRYQMDEERIYKYAERDHVLDLIIDNEPTLQCPDRYPTDNWDEHLCRERDLLKHREAEEFYDGILFQIDKEMEAGLVLGSICYVKEVGWVAEVYDTTRHLSIVEENG